MKSRFNTIDILASVSELQSKLQGMRVQQVYDIDNKTYLIKLSKQESKAVLLLESGCRIHSTEFDWPKNPAPSGFSMKLRKHLKSRRFEKINLLGVDRIVDIQFGSSEAAYHVIIELYDRGNICLTDFEYKILNLLRVRTDDSLDVRIAVQEKYPVQSARQHEPFLSIDRLKQVLCNARPADSLKKVLNPHFVYGPALIEHVLLDSNFKENVLMSDIDLETEVNDIYAALRKAEDFISNCCQIFSKGYIIQKTENRVIESDSLAKEIVTYQEFHPYLFHQHKGLSHVEFEQFDKAVDEFFSKLEGQKLDLKTVQQEKSALKKLENVRKDHIKRVSQLQKSQESDKFKAELIEMNLDDVDRAITIIRSAIANQIDWSEIEDLIKEAKDNGDPVALAVKSLKLDKNHFVMLLGDPYEHDPSVSGVHVKAKKMPIELDLDLTAYANARRYFDQKKHALKKENKTVEASQKALKSAERKTKQTLKEVAVAATINRTRKTFWFEKFLWFISSENYLVIGGRDQQQNEMIVKRYMRTGDVYVHADLHGATSIVIKNPSGSPIPPKTLNEAGTMAVCCSAGWEAKIVTSSWWVHANQVSKTAPSGEYLTTGSFMIRGKKNYLPSCHLIMGFGFLFKLDEEFIEQHKKDRKVLIGDDEPEQPQEVLNEANEEIPLDADEENCENSSEETEKDKEPEVRNIEKSESEEEESLFPDTQINLKHASGDQFEIEVNEEHNENNEPSDQKVVFFGDDKPVKIKEKSANPNKEMVRENKLKNTKPTEPSTEVVSIQSEKSSGLKRGQKAKIKKIKQKYKDQDEEEKNLRMQILASAGSRDKPKKKKDIRAEKKKKHSQKTSNVPTPVILHDETATADEANVVIPDDQVDSDEEEKTNKDQLSDVLYSLTGCPNPEDGLLFSVPICAPYGTLQNYKYKVKITPGTGRRGKAAKTAVQIFLKSKDITQREKDLLKTVKDQDISRNLPGKVKLSAPQSAIQKTR